MGPDPPPALCSPGSKADQQACKPQERRRRRDRLALAVVRGRSVVFENAAMLCGLR